MICIYCKQQLGQCAPDCHRGRADRAHSLLMAVGYKIKDEHEGGTYDEKVYVEVIDRIIGERDELKYQLKERDIFSVVQEAGASIENGRTPFSILAAIVAEVGELAEEVAINQGMSYKRHGSDGVIGEAIDVIASVVDLIYTVDPHISHRRLMEILTDKLEKWKTKTAEHGKFGGPHGK